MINSITELKLKDFSCFMAQNNLLTGEFYGKIN